MSDNAELRKRLEEFYKKHAPQDIAKVDAALKLKASEEELFKKLHKKYNLNDKGEPMGDAKDPKEKDKKSKDGEKEAAPADDDKAELRKRLEEFYKKHAPQDIAKVDAALKLKASEEELFKKLHKKYNLNDKGEPMGDAKDDKPKEEVKSEKKDDAAPADDDKAELRKRLEEFYKKHAPQDIAKVDAALKLKASEEELFKKLHKKYNLNDKGEPMGDAKDAAPAEEVKPAPAPPSPVSPKKGPPSPGMAGKKGPPQAALAKKKQMPTPSDVSNGDQPSQEPPRKQSIPPQQPAPKEASQPTTPLKPSEPSPLPVTTDAPPATPPSPAPTRNVPPPKAEPKDEVPPPVEHNNNSRQARMFAADDLVGESSVNIPPVHTSTPTVQATMSRSDFVRDDDDDLSALLGAKSFSSPAAGGGANGSVFRCRVTIGHHFPAAKNHYLHSMTAAQQREFMRCLGADLKACLQRAAGSQGSRQLVSDLLSSDVTEGNSIAGNGGSAGVLAGGLHFHWALTYSTPQAARACYSTFKQATFNAEALNLNGTVPTHGDRASSPLFNGSPSPNRFTPGSGSFRLSSPPSASSAYLQGGVNQHQVPPTGTALIQIPQARLAYSDAWGRPSDIPCGVLSEMCAVYDDGTADGPSDSRNHSPDHIPRMLADKDTELSRMNELLNSRAADISRPHHYDATPMRAAQEDAPSNALSPINFRNDASPSHSLFSPGKGSMYNPATSENTPGVPMRDLIDLKDREKALRDQEGYLQDAQSNLTKQSKRIQAMMDEQLRRMELVEKREQQLHTREREIEEEKVAADQGLRKQLREAEVRLTDLASENEILKLRLHNMALHKAHHPQDLSASPPFAHHYNQRDDLKDRLLKEREDQIAERMRQVDDRETRLRELESRAASGVGSTQLLSELSPYRNEPRVASAPISSYPGHQAASPMGSASPPRSQREEEVRAMMSRMQARDAQLSRR